MTAQSGPDQPAADRRTQRLAKLFDLRTFIGALFLIFGVVVTVEGLNASAADIAKAAGVRLSLWTGLSMLVVGALFLTWMLLKPPETEVERQDLSKPPDYGRH
jgi:xanthine/uracil/vitamin C permease (AzgA family)